MITKATTGSAIVTIRQKGMLFDGGINRTTVWGVCASTELSAGFGVGLGFGVALALPVLAIPIPEISPSERIIAINFSGIDKLVSVFQVK